MKKMIALMIAMSFCAVSGGSALAGEPVTNSLDNHAVWSNWFDASGHRISGTLGATDSTTGVEQKISTQSLSKRDVKGKSAKFGFIRETKKYDYTKDRGHSA